MADFLSNIFHPEFRDEQLQILWRSKSANGIGTVLLALIMGVYLWDCIPDPDVRVGVLVWSAANIFAGIWLYFSYGARARRAASSLSPPQPRLGELVAFETAICGILVGGIAFFFPYLDQPTHFVLATLVVGTAGFAAITGGAFPVVPFSYVTGIMLLPFLYFFRVGDSSYTVFGLLGVAAAFILMMITRAFHRTTLEMLKNSRLNEELLAAISAERKAAAKSLSESEERYADIVENIGDMIQISSPDGEIVFTNEAWRTKLGYQSHEVADLEFSNYIDEKSLALATERMATVASGGTVASADLLLKTKGGETFWVDASGSARWVDGKLMGVRAIYRDITARKEDENRQAEIRAVLEKEFEQATIDLSNTNRFLEEEAVERRRIEMALRESEARLRLILNSTAEMIYGVDLHGRGIFCNTSFLNCVGLESEQEFIGASAHDLLHVCADGEDDSEGNCDFCQGGRNGVALRGADQRFRRKDGSEFAVEYSASPILDGGEITGTVVGFIDITERLLLDEQLRQSQKLDALGQLTGGIAHDFNNILAVISGTIDLTLDILEDGSDNQVEAARKQLDVALTATERCAALTSRLLAFSRKTELTTTIFNPSELVQNLRTLLEKTLNESIILEIDVQDGIWPIKSDAAQLENALINLAANARDAMPDGGRLTYHISNKSVMVPYRDGTFEVPPGDYVRICATDQGAGMTPDVLEKVFDPFFTTKDIGKGTGLGLSMIFGFVQQSGGGVGMSSSPENGTSVALYFPRATEKDVGKNKPARNDSDHKGDINSALAGKTVLLVEDQRDLREVLKAQLESARCHVLAADSGNSAVSLFDNAAQVDILLTDVIMPGGANGFQLAGQLQERNPDLKVIITSGYHQVTSDGAVIDADQYELLAKPVRKKELLNALYRAVSA